MKKPLRVAIAVLLALVAASHPAIARGQGQGGGTIQGPTITKLRGLVILIDFSDKPADVTVTRANQIINGVGYTEATVTRSLRDYWFAQSRGRVELTHEVVGYYRAPQTAAWYQARTFNEYITLLRSALDWTVANRPNLDWNALSLASGPMTLRLIAAWNKLVGVDIVDQAISHLDPSERDRLKSLWRQKKAA